MTPLGFQALYWLPAQLGIDPLLVNKLLPPVLGLGLAYYAFRLTLRIVPVPAAAFLGSALTVFFMWLMEDTASGTPRAFAVPLFLAFLCCLVEGRTRAVVAIALLQGLFYPQMSLVYPGVLALSLLRWRDGRPVLTREREAWRRAVLAMAAIVVSLLPFLVTTSEFGPAITAAEVRSSPAFQPGGRTEFFLPDKLDFYLCGVRSGLLPVQWGCYSAYDAGLGIAPVLALAELAFALGLPLWLVLRAGPSGPGRSGPGRPRRGVWLLAAAVASGTAVFIAAHLLLFRLHLPARYGQHTLRAVSMVLLAVALAPALVRLSRWPERGSAWRRAAVWLGSLALVGGLFAVTIALPIIPRTEDVHGAHPALYAYVAAQPKDTVIASLAAEADSLPSFAARTVLATREYAIPYSTGYITELRARSVALIEAQYAPDIAAIRHYVERYGVSLLLLDADAFSAAHVRGAWWRREYPRAAEAALAGLEGGIVPALARLVPPCGTRPDPAFIAIQAACIRGAE